MTEQNPTPTPAATPQAPSAAAAQQPPVPDPAPTPVPPSPASGETKFEDLPDSWQREIASLRKEAAENRVKAKSATTEQDSTLERIAALETELETARAERDTEAANRAKTQILAERGISNEYLPMLTGDDADAWGQAADLLVGLRGNRGVTPDPVQAAMSNHTNTTTAREQQAATFFAGLN